MEIWSEEERADPNFGKATPENAAKVKAKALSKMDDATLSDDERYLASLVFVIASNGKFRPKLRSERGGLEDGK